MTLNCEEPQTMIHKCPKGDLPPEYCDGDKVLPSKTDPCISGKQQQEEQLQRLKQGDAEFCTTNKLLGHQKQDEFKSDDRNRQQKYDNKYEQCQIFRQLYQSKPDFILVDQQQQQDQCTNEEQGKEQQQKGKYCTCKKKSPKKKLAKTKCDDCQKPVSAQPEQASGHALHNMELKSKLAECIRNFDRGSPDTMKSLNTLKNLISEKMLNEQCFPKREWPHCPAVEGSEPYEVAHPYIPGMTLYSKPRYTTVPVKVTVDGRPAELPRPRRYYHEEQPLNVPPWVLPRYKSQELRGGLLLKGCHCWKKNGLQDDCPRWDCGGRPECCVRPLPVCPPAMAPPICGVRKPNLFDGKPPGCKKPLPPPPYPVQQFTSINAKEVPNAPSIPCPLHTTC